MTSVVQRLDSDLECFSGFRKVIARRSKRKSEKAHGLARRLALIASRDNLESARETEKSVQEEAQAVKSATVRQVLLESRDQRLMEAIVAVALKDGADPESVQEELEELEAKSDDDRKALLLQMIHTNSNNEFVYFKPMCFSDCDMGGDRYKAPPDRYPDGQSDDEEWLKDDPLGASTQQYYVEMLDVCNRSSLKYYGKEQKQKLRFAIQRWTSGVILLLL